MNGLRALAVAARPLILDRSDDPEAAGKLILQMRTGGSGKWGVVPMLPFEGKIPAGEMQRLAGWILGYRWDSVLAD